MAKETNTPKKYYYKVYFYVGLESEKKKHIPVNHHCGQGIKSVVRNKPYFSGIPLFRIEAERSLKTIFKKEQVFIDYSHAKSIKEAVFNSFEDELELYPPYLQMYKDGLL